MRSAILLLGLSLSITGCARFHSVQTDIAPDKSARVTRVSIWSFFDSHNDVTKLKTTATDKTQGISVGSISENTSGTNALEMLHAVGTILQNMPK